MAASAVAVIIGAIGFLRRQRRLPEPLLDFGIFTNRALVSGVIAAAVGMFAVGGIEMVTTQRFQLVAGFTPLEAGLLVTPAALASLPTALLAGAFLHRVGLRVLISGGMALGALGVIITAFGLGRSLPLMIIGFVLLGFGIGATFAVASTAIVGNVPARRAGMASSVEEVSYEFGSLIAVALLGSLLGLVYSATVSLPGGASPAAGTSIGDALRVAGDNAAVMAAARDAYDLGYLVTLVVIAAVIALGAAVTARLLRYERPGTDQHEPADHSLEEVR